MVKIGKEKINIIYSRKKKNLDPIWKWIIAEVPFDVINNPRSNFMHIRFGRLASCLHNDKLFEYNRKKNDCYKENLTEKIK